MCDKCRHRSTGSKPYSIETELEKAKSILNSNGDLDTIEAALREISQPVPEDKLPNRGCRWVELCSDSHDSVISKTYIMETHTGCFVRVRSVLSEGISVAETVEFVPGQRLRDFLNFEGESNE